MSGYVLPGCTSDQELASLKAHAKFFELSRSSGLMIDDDEKARILQICETAYERSRYRLPSDWMSYTHFERVVRQLDFRSSPGYPYCLSHSTNGDMLGWDGVNLCPERVLNLWHDVQLFLAGEFESLYRVFIKSEPHKVSKARLDRWRLIICSPLCEQVVWTMVFGSGNDKQIETVGETPSMQGMSMPGGDWKDHLRLFKAKDLTVPMDKSAWDWTAHIELIQLDLTLRSRLLQAERPVKDKWLGLANMLYDRAFNHPTLVLSNGQMFKQLYPGIMKSGCVNTISSNSHMQVFIHILTCMRKGSVSVFPLPCAVGDDTLNSLRNSFYPEDYAFTGAIIKEVGEEMEFVGHRWNVDGPIPLYSAKHLVRYASVKKNDIASFLDSMVRLYAHSPEFQDLWRYLAELNGVDLPSEEFVRFWYDYSDSVYC